MTDLPYSLIVEATEEPDFFAFYSPGLEGFSGIGHSIEDCLYQARWAMKEHFGLLESQGLQVPARSTDPKITIQTQGKRPQRTSRSSAHRTANIEEPDREQRLFSQDYAIARGCFGNRTSGPS